MLLFLLADGHKVPHPGGDERRRVIAERGYGQRKGDPPMAKNYVMTAIRRSLVEAHSSVTPGQGAERPQPGDSSEQRKSASEVD